MKVTIGGDFGILDVWEYTKKSLAEADVPLEEDMVGLDLVPFFGSDLEELGFTVVAKGGDQVAQWELEQGGSSNHCSPERWLEQALSE
ncbi:hypothetical protein OAX78_00605 [Planctomycetota bacterium]|nr:hypothetical protein [Planctomycetota bacterium]